MRLKDKVALITGAGSGIGRETALLFAAGRRAVVVVDLTMRPVKRRSTEIEAAGGKAVVCPCGCLESGGLRKYGSGRRGKLWQAEYPVQ